MPRVQKQRKREVLLRGLSEKDNHSVVVLRVPQQPSVFVASGALDWQAHDVRRSQQTDAKRGRDCDPFKFMLAEG